MKVEEFEYPNESRSHAVGSFILPTGSPKADRSLVDRADKEGFQKPSKGLVLPGPQPGARPGVGACR